MPTHYSAFGSLYLDNQLISNSCRMTVGDREETELQNVNCRQFGPTRMGMSLHLEPVDWAGFLAKWCPKTYADRVTDALRAEGGRYAEAWWTGGNPYMSSGKAKRIGRLMRIQARARRLQGV